MLVADSDGLKGSFFRPDEFATDGMTFLAGTILDDFLACPCTASSRNCTDLAHLGHDETDHSLSLREETTNQ